MKRRSQKKTLSYKKKNILIGCRTIKLWFSEIWLPFLILLLNPVRLLFIVIKLLYVEFSDYLGSILACKKKKKIMYIYKEKAIRCDVYRCTGFHQEKQRQLYLTNICLDMLAFMLLLSIPGTMMRGGARPPLPAGPLN